MVEPGTYVVEVDSDYIEDVEVEYWSEVDNCQLAGYPADIQVIRVAEVIEFV